MAGSDGYDIAYHWDPVCPFAWLTSKWVRMVRDERGYQVDWRFISLRILNKSVDYDSHFPEGYEAGHDAGLAMLRVAASVRAAHGRDAMGPLYEAFGTRLFDVPPEESVVPGEPEANRSLTAQVLADAGFDAAHLDALDDTSFDAEIEAETEDALGRTGRDVGTPIIQHRPPDGPAFFGPVISRLPSPDEAAHLWDLVTGLVSYPGFAELKRSLREFPQLAAFGGDPNAVAEMEDWHGGSRRLKK